MRDILGIKQETIAFEMNMTQQNFSNLEQKAEIDNNMLEKIAEIMKIPVEAIKNFNEERVVNIIINSLHDNSCVNSLHGNSGLIMYNPTFNAMDKVIELYEKTTSRKR